MKIPILVPLFLLAIFIILFLSAENAQYRRAIASQNELLQNLAEQYPEIKNF